MLRITMALIVGLLLAACGDSATGPSDGELPAGALARYVDTGGKVHLYFWGDHTWSVREGSHENRGEWHYVWDDDGTAMGLCYEFFRPQPWEYRFNCMSVPSPGQGFMDSRAVLHLEVDLWNWVAGDLTYTR